MSTEKHTQAWRDRKKQQGLCPECGKNPSDNSRRCSDCLGRAAVDNKQRFQRRYDNGLCGYCGKREYTQGKKSCKTCLSQHREKYADNKDKICQQASLLRQARRSRILEHYGNKCICCGETEPLFLSIDHISGGGNKHRREIGNNKNHRCGSSSTQFAKWVEANHYPDTLQILCHNCNMGKHLNGGVCPHKNDSDDYIHVPPNKTYTVKTRYVYKGKGEPPDNWQTMNGVQQTWEDISREE